MLATALLAACGPSVQLADLRCDTPCQEAADPFTARLLVDYVDPEDLLPQGALLISVNNRAVPSLPLAGRVTAGAETGSIALQVPLTVNTLETDQLYRVRVVARTAEGDSAAQLLDLRLSL